MKWPPREEFTLKDEFEVVVLQRGRHRFEWNVCNNERVPIAKGCSASVAQARSDGFKAKARFSGY
jgi:hypothetical protein